MYAVIRAGGKQHKVAKGDIIEVEHITGGRSTVEFTPLLVVDDKGKVRSGKSELAKATVQAKVVEETKGTKLEIYKYKNKTGYRRHTGHRQKYTRIEISNIKLSGSTTTEAKPTEAKAAEAKTTAPKKTTAKKTTGKKTTAKSSKEASDGS
jgi:large subunit ribosomal protein L21